MSAPETIEVFGEDGELHWIETKSASIEALEDAIEVLEKRAAAIHQDIKLIRRLLAARQIANPDPERAARAFHKPYDLPSPEEVRSEGRRQAVEGLLKLVRSAPAREPVA